MTKAGQICSHRSASNRCAGSGKPLAGLLSSTHTYVASSCHLYNLQETSSVTSSQMYVWKKTQCGLRHPSLEDLGGLMTGKHLILHSLPFWLLLLVALSLWTRSFLLTCGVPLIQHWGRHSLASHRVMMSLILHSQSPIAREPGGTPDPALRSALSCWPQGHDERPRSSSVSHRQRAWDSPRIHGTYDSLLDVSLDLAHKLDCWLWPPKSRVLAQFSTYLFCGSAHR